MNDEWTFDCKHCGKKIDAFADKGVLWIDKDRHDKFTTRILCTRCASENDYEAPESAHEIYWFLFWKEAQQRFVKLERMLRCVCGPFAWPFVTLLAFLRADEVRGWRCVGRLDDWLGEEKRLERARRTASAIGLHSSSPFFPQPRILPRKNE